MQTRLDILTTIHLRQCRLSVVRGEARGQELVVAADVIRIGKARENDLVLPEETVSRVHCEILRDTRGYLLRDLGSTNGTFLDGAEIREAYVRGGSVITAGTVQIAFQPVDEVIEAVPSAQEAFGELVGPSRAMREIFGLLERIAPTEVTVLVQGELGTGKDLCARMIHKHSRRAAGPFVVVDCTQAGAALEGELYGYERGAQPAGAEGTRTSARQGAFEIGAGGTVYLDEVSELPLELQSKLLGVLERRELRRIGGTRSIRVDARVVAATRQDLAREVERGKFREDLHRRLAGVPITLPPLRDRREDLPLLARERLRRQRGGAGPAPELPGLGLLTTLFSHHAWPGNVRELGEVVALLGPSLQSAPSAAAESEFEPTASYRENKERWNDAFERRYLRWLLDRATGNISRAAREADMDRKHLHKLLKKHGISD
jgi:DNA-binding NtrC family response regulator